MRRFYTGLVVAGLFVFCGSTQAMAQKSPAGKDLNERIQALRNRLQNFQAQRSGATSVEKSTDQGDLIFDQLDTKGEKIVEELESRPDVALTVLFHDTGNETVAMGSSIQDVSALTGTNEISAAVGPSKQVFANVSESSAEKAEAKMVLASAVAPESQLPEAQVVTKDSRLKRYEELRQRVYQVTRNARVQAADINQQIARIQ